MDSESNEDPRSNLIWVLKRGVIVSQSERDFVEASFNMETGRTAKKISKIGFCTYIIEADDGKLYKFR